MNRFTAGQRRAFLLMLLVDSNGISECAEYLGIVLSSVMLKNPPWSSSMVSVKVMFQIPREAFKNLVVFNVPREHGAIAGTKITPCFVGHKARLDLVLWLYSQSMVIHRG